MSYPFGPSLSVTLRQRESREFLEAHLHDAPPLVQWIAGLAALARQPEPPTAAGSSSDDRTRYDSRSPL